MGKLVPLKKDNIIQKIFLSIIKVYRFFSKYTPPVCRFTPTCSQYAYEAIKKYGAIKGGFLSIKRILKCHPYHKGGYDRCRKNTL